ncbi:complement regulator-acquiring protein (plasmid) [Borreliella americana]|uniref:Complement regulator-acquiring protein n=1 Tax=Borreliella americana TaxID=478807 RepID=A0ACD5G661_9SPIR
MKYHIIVSIFVFLFLNACNQDSNTNQNNSNKELKTERIPNKQIQNTLLDDLKNLIETANTDKKKYEKKLKEEPSNQYGMSIFKEIYWVASYETVADNTERSKNYRKFIYATLNSINTNKLANLSNILIRSKQKTLLFGTFCNFGSTFDTVINHLSLKKDTLNTLAVSNLKKLKNSFEKLLSIKTDISKMLEQLLLDYKDYINSTRTDVDKLESYLTELYKQIAKKSFQATGLKNNILSISNL